MSPSPTLPPGFEPIPAGFQPVAEAPRSALPKGFQPIPEGFQAMEQTVPGSERTGLPGPPRPPLPGELAPTAPPPPPAQRLNPRTGLPMTPTWTPLDIPITGAQEAASGVQRIRTALPQAAPELGYIGREVGRAVLPEAVPPVTAPPALTPETHEAVKQVARGTSEVIGGTMKAAAPILLPAGLLSAPAATVGTIAAAETGRYATQKGLESAGVSPEMAGLAGDVVSLAVAGGGVRYMVGKWDAAIDAHNATAGRLLAQEQAAGRLGTTVDDIFLGESHPIRVNGQDATLEYMGASPEKGRAGFRVVRDSDGKVLYAGRGQTVQDWLRTNKAIPRDVQEPQALPMEPAESPAAVAQAPAQAAPELPAGVSTAPPPPEGFQPIAEAPAPVTPAPKAPPVSIAAGARFTTPEGDEYRVLSAGKKQVIFEKKTESGKISGQMSRPAFEQMVGAMPAPTPIPAPTATPASTAEAASTASPVTAPPAAPAEGESGQDMIRGSSNIPLTQLGREEAADLAKRTAGQFDKIYTSTMDRAKETATAVQETNPDAEFSTTRKLTPWFLGEHEGKPTEQVLDKLNDLIQNHPDQAPKGRGPKSTADGQSFSDFKDDFLGFVQKQVKDYKPGEKILDVTHYRDVRLLESWAKNGAPEDRSIDTAEMLQKGDVHPGGLWRLDPSTMQVSAVNDASLPGIYFARHGATAWNAENREAPSTAGPEGVQQSAVQTQYAEPAVGEPLPAPATPAPESPTLEASRAPQEESLQDRSYREWAENAGRVAANPEAASEKDLRRAIGYLDHRRRSIIRKAQEEGRTLDPNVLSGYDAEEAHYLSLIKKHETAAGVSPVEPKAPAAKPDLAAELERLRAEPGSPNSPSAKTPASLSENNTGLIRRFLREETGTSNLGALSEAIRARGKLSGKGVQPGSNPAAGVRDSIDKLKAATAAIFKGYAQPRASILIPTGGKSVTDYERAVGRWSGADNRSALDLYRFRKAGEKAIPDKRVREAITNWIEAGGDQSLLQQRAAASRANPYTVRYAKGYEDAANLTPEQVEVARDIMRHNDAVLDEMRAAGILQQGVENYVSHIYKDDPAVVNKVRAQLNFDSLQTKPYFTRKRVFASYFDAEQASRTPRDKDVFFLVAAHERALREALAAREFIAELKDGAAKDGRPLVITSWAMAKQVGEGELGPTLIRPNIKRGEEAGDYRPINHPALRGWRWAGEDNEGEPIIVQGDMLVHPEIYRHLKNNLTKGAISRYTVAVGGREVHPGRWMLEGVAGIKHFILSLSRFHETTLEFHAGEHRTFPFGLPDLDMESPDQRLLVNGGLMVAHYEGMDAFAEGLAGAGWLTKLPGIGQYLDAYTSYLFKERLPEIKMATALHALARNRERYAAKGYTDEKIAQITAKQMNAAFGGLNLRMLGRNRTVQELLRLVFMAPDFLEARAKFAGQALRPQGREQLVALLFGAAALYAIFRLLNQAINGKPEWDKPFSLIRKGKEYSLRSVQEDLWTAATDTGRFLHNRLSPLYGATMDYLESGQNGKAKSAGGPSLTGTLRREVPIPVQPWTRGGSDPTSQKVIETVLRVLGVNVKGNRETETPEQRVERLRQAYQRRIETMRRKRMSAAR